jgi:hypothetical protein
MGTVSRPIIDAPKGAIWLREGFDLHHAEALYATSFSAFPCILPYSSTVTHSSGLSASGLLPTESGALPSFADQNPGFPVPIIFRASNGKGKKKRDDKVKISTVVQPDDLALFYERYAEVCRTGMDSLKKRDRSRLKKKKREQKSKGPDSK